MQHVSEAYLHVCCLHCLLDESMCYISYLVVERVQVEKCILFRHLILAGSVVHIYISSRYRLHFQGLFVLHTVYAFILPRIFKYS